MCRLAGCWWLVAGSVGGWLPRVGSWVCLLHEVRASIGGSSALC